MNGVFVIQPERVEDERGFFARVWSREAFQPYGLYDQFVEWSISFNAKKGTLRGLHYQAAPHGEAKLVQCTRGRAYDVALDLRVDSPTYKCWTSVALGEDNTRLVYLPPGVAHGFMTLQDDTELYYHISHEYVPQAARGVRWDDPAFAIKWPIVPPAVISARDASYQDITG